VIRLAEFPGGGTMKKASSVSLSCLCFLASLGSALAQEKPSATSDAEKARVFITDSQSWSIAGASGGGGGAYGGTMAGGARPQTAEIIKTFGERCPQVTINNIQTKTDYIVLLDHEGGKGALRHKNKVAVFARVSGDSIVSKSTLSLGGSVKDACEAITKDWTEHGASIRAAAAEQSKPAVTPQAATPVVAAPAPVPAAAVTGKLAVTSVPDGADIEVDGSFVGNTPSDVQVTEGEHTVTLKKAGFKDWGRKLKVSGGSSVHLNAELEKAVTP
jgi:PEGA domain